MLETDKKIMELQRVREKIALYQRLQENVRAEKDEASAAHAELESKFPGLLAEFISEVELFCDKRVVQLDQGAARILAPAEPAPKPQASQPTHEPLEPAEELPPPPEDPIRFLMQHRYLEGKNVEFDTPQGKGQGQVRGMVAPFIRVQTSRGVQNILPENLRVI